MRSCNVPHRLLVGEARRRLRAGMRPSTPMQVRITTGASYSPHNTHSGTSSPTSREPSIYRAGYRTWNLDHGVREVSPPTERQPGSIAFADCEFAAVQDLFNDFAKHKPHTDGGIDERGAYLCIGGVKNLLASLGERPDDLTLSKLFRAHDLNGDGKLHLDEFLLAADAVLGGAPARIVLVVGGPGSGKGLLCSRLEQECAVVHMSSGNLLRDEVERDTPLGRECASIMARGELVSSAVITALVRRRMRNYPGRRVLLDGFPRSLENATDFMELCGKPELALHLDCDDTILMERILKRSREGDVSGKSRSDDNIETALKRLKTYHKYHRPTMEWLREQHVPVVNLDCSGTPENVWQQLLAIGRLMRPVASPGGVAPGKGGGGLFDEHLLDGTG